MQKNCGENTTGHRGDQKGEKKKRACFPHGVWETKEKRASYNNQGRKRRPRERGGNGKGKMRKTGSVPEI